ncbi:MAG: 4-(cytidine 5'-diphospho)-2-C-methyl-D-erythritol kinase [Candidatus Omnitrophica bacterium]|nr:4-(cytidine 5'-diphospho)-2-C-methyl-D-erythritol kinase [Candidatus Omnitrophota bacterium]
MVSPAKINLFLSVLRRRPDGAHEIETVFERISLCDEIRLAPLKDGKILLRTDCPGVPDGPSNLAWRAARILQEKYAAKQGVRIGIRKRIPVAAGLGGGSSNAATVLLGLNRLWRLRLSRKELLRLGASLGSDVPFFILESPFAVGRGRGERLRKIKAPRRKLWHCLVKPGFSISTRKAYEGLKKVKLTPPQADVKILLRAIRNGRLERFPKLLVNSLEAVLGKRVIEILKIKKELTRQGAAATLLSGSGSSVFGVFASRAQAIRAARFLGKNKQWRAFAVSTF